MLGKYKIIAPLGSGGFGTVYLAQDTWIDKKVAIKVPHRQGLDFGELLREPRLLASVSHPNIVAITTAEKQDDVFFIVMEYVHGRDAREHHRPARRARADARARLHLPDLQRRRSRARAGRHPPRPAARQRARHRPRHAEGRRLRHVAVPRDRGARDDGDRQPALHGAGAVSRQGGVRLGPLFARRDDVPDADRACCRTTRQRPADLDKLMSGELVSPPRLKQSRDPESHQRHRHEGDGARHDGVATSARPTCSRTCSPRAAPREPRRQARCHAPQPAAARGRDDAQSIQSRLRAREAPAARFCWHCRKPLHARTDRCPFCGETQ